MTANDFTVYFERLSADQLPLAFRLEADRMHKLFLSKNDFDKEIQVVMEERRMCYDDNPTSLAYERFMAAAFVNSPYHHRVDDRFATHGSARRARLVSCVVCSR